MNLAKSLSGNVLEGNTINCLIESLVTEFGRATDLIVATDDRIYRHDLEADRSIGSHFRHNFDFANNWLAGLVTSRIDYTRRKRDPMFEQDRQYALARIRVLVNSLQDISVEMLDTQVAVRSEVDESVWHRSSAMRELEFIHSHTVHHHAMVAEKLKAMHVEVPVDLGVAPSTLKFWAERDLFING